MVELLSVRVVGDWTWHLPAGVMLSDNELSPEQWVAQKHTVVKQNLQRTVYRFSTSAGAVYAKLLRVNSPRSAIRDWFRGPKAKLEADRLVQLRNLGIAVPELLGWGRGPGASAMITREVPNAVPLEAILSLTLTPKERKRLTHEIGFFLGYLHSAGIVHPDPHPGNVLLADGRLVLLDTHAVQFNQVNKELPNLVLLNRWFQNRTTATDRARFWLAYRGIHTTRLATDDAAFRRLVEVRTHDSNLRFWQQRRKRYVGSNRQIQPLKVGHWRGHSVTDVSMELLAQLSPDPLAPFATGAPYPRLKDGPSSTVVLLPNGVLLKRFRIKKRSTLIKNFFRPSNAMRSWINGHSLLDRGVATARPFLLLEQRQRGVTGEAVLAFEFLVGATELKPALNAADEVRRAELIDRLALLLRRMHHVGVGHRDLKASNILETSRREPVLIDLVGVTLGTKVSVAIRQRDLSRLAASFIDSDVIRHSHRLRFLRRYLGPSQWEGWKVWWRQIVRLLDRKQMKNAQSGRPLT
jgi:tRNA A-37 threonylcarbamoyl transferase component Bud32